MTAFGQPFAHFAKISINTYYSWTAYKCQTENQTIEFHLLSVMLYQSGLI